MRYIQDPSGLLLPDRRLIRRPEPRLCSILPGWFPGATFEAVIPPSLEYQTHKISTTNGTVFSFSSVDIGDEPAAGETRHIILGVSARIGSGGAATYSNVTINGIACSQAVTRATPGQSAQRASLYIAEVPSDTTATISFTSSRNADNGDIGVWAAYNLTSASPVDTASSISNPADLSMDVMKGDLLVAFSGANSSSGDASSSWSGMTERFDDQFEFGVGYKCAGADHTATVSETPRTITVTYANLSGTPQWSVAVAAAWR